MSFAGGEGRANGLEREEIISHREDNCDQVKVVTIAYAFEQLMG